MKKIILVLSMIVLSTAVVFAKTERPISKINDLIEDDIEANSEEIEEIAATLTFSDKTLVYEHNKKTFVGPILLNLFTIPGIGSFVQGDTVTGWICLGGTIALTGISAYCIIDSVWNFFLSVFDSLVPTGNSSNAANEFTWSQIELYIYIGAVIAQIGLNIYGAVRAATYAADYNTNLRTKLGLKKSDVSFAPIVDPVNKEYGLVASIKI